MFQRWDGIAWKKNLSVGSWNAMTDDFDMNCQQQFRMWFKSSLCFRLTQFFYAAEWCSGNNPFLNGFKLQFST